MRTRITAVVAAKTDAHRKYKQMEELTGVKAASWKAICEGRQRANEEHLSAIARCWPGYALWLLTGRTQAEAGQTSPELEQLEALQRSLGGQRDA
ncbi:MAG: DNA-binding protein [Candidatus Accumulibacter sp.]|nr:DNA-binding protein [Accumulibacter sp.]MBA4094281.1 DNA-binding protein [Accumulibacter sp.]MBN9423188.1 DNA-binding protein [Accumulibacter sp.]